MFKKHPQPKYKIGDRVIVWSEKLRERIILTVCGVLTREYRHYKMNPRDKPLRYVKYEFNETEELRDELEIVGREGEIE